IPGRNFPSARVQTFRSLLHYYTHSLGTVSPRPIHSKLCLVGPGTTVGVSRILIRARCAISEVPQPTRNGTGRFIGKIHIQGSLSLLIKLTFPYAYRYVIWRMNASKKIITGGGG